MNHDQEAKLYIPSFMSMLRKYKINEYYMRSQKLLITIVVPSL